MFDVNSLCRSLLEQRVRSMDLTQALLASYGNAYHLAIPTLLLSFLICVIASSILLRRYRLRLPPGPPGIPVIGHFHLLGTNPHCSLAELSKKYGSLMFLRFGSVPVIVASSPATARLIFQTHDQNFSWRSRPAAAMHIYECKNMLFSQPGPYFRLMRQISISDLFGNKRLEGFRPLISREIHELLLAIVRLPDKVPVRASLYEASLSIISKMAIGKHVKDIATQSQSDPSNNLVAILLEVVYLLGVFNMGDYIPLLAWMDLQGVARRGKAVSKKMRTVWQEVIDERRKERLNRTSDTADADFLDVLLTTSSNQKEFLITDLHIMATLTDMFAAGIDTSTVTVEWALAELLKHPHILKKLQDELDAVVGSNRLVQDSDIRELPYLRAVVKETMRLHPVLPLLVPHTAKEQCELSGYDIPSGTQAYVNVWAIGRDPTIWEKPLEFLPERFLNSNIDVRGQHFELLPFGSGRRSCPGLVLGINNVHLILASLVQAFDWMPIGELDMTEKFGIVVTLANALVAKAEPRVPRHLVEVKKPE
ncbi:hypothetical protein KP509_1Z071300 [Ceratopteris richardii]|nr:hypothetical protein KP509_1Z071300 [Ceratopteris richardii]